MYCTAVRTSPSFQGDPFRYRIKIPFYEPVPPKPTPSTSRTPARSLPLKRFPESENFIIIDRQIQYQGANPW